jgi:general secretion pathway protein I
MTLNRLPDSARSGFTLVELLVALAVLAVALAAAVASLSQGIDLAAALRARTLARWVAEDRLTYHRLAAPWPEIATTEGTSEMGGRTWWWREVVAGTPIGELRRIEIEVRADPQAEVLARLVGFLRKPPS